MKHSDIDRTMSVELALGKIKCNASQKFDWYIVQNKTGCVFELGGTNRELKAYIPYYDKHGIPKKYPHNEMVHMNFSITTYGNHPDDGLSYDESKFISIVKAKDFRKATFEKGVEEEVVVCKSLPARIKFE